MKRNIIIHILALIAFCATLVFLPSWWCGRGANEWISGNLNHQLKLARGIEHLVLNEKLSLSSFHTGSEKFNGEWLFGTFLMAGMGFGQMALTYPELSKPHAEVMERCIEQLMDPQVRYFDTVSWKEDALKALDGSNDHAAYLGYLNLLLSMHRLVSAKNTYAQLNDRITAFLIRNLKDSPFMLLETYPGEAYPVDNCFVIGSIGLHQRVTGLDHSTIIHEWLQQARTHFVDAQSGLFIQSVDSKTGAANDAPRGSGSAFGLFALRYADEALANELYQGIKRSLARKIMGFGLVREYPDGVNGKADIDSGPIFLDIGLSATGFSIAGARMHDDFPFFKSLYTTAHLFGAPIKRDERWEYISGGPLGNAIMFAMLTAPKSSLNKS